MRLPCNTHPHPHRRVCASPAPGGRRNWDSFVCMYIKAAEAKGHPKQDSAARHRAGTDADAASGTRRCSRLNLALRAGPRLGGWGVGSAIAGSDRNPALVRVVNVFKKQIKTEQNSANLELSFRDKAGKKKGEKNQTRQRKGERRF